MTCPTRTNLNTDVRPACVHLEEVRLAFDAIRAVVALSPTAAAESENLSDAIRMLCERGGDEIRAVRAALQRAPGERTVPAAPRRSGLRADRDTNGSRVPFTVRGEPWTFDRVVHWTHAVETRLALLPEEESYATWRADLADAGIGIESTDEWPRVQKRLSDHWEHLGSDYARRWWSHNWYTRLLDPRLCGWPDEDP